MNSKLFQLEHCDRVAERARRRAIWGGILILLCSAGYAVYGKSRISRRIEAAGLGKVLQAPISQIEKCFTSHPALALEIAEQCRVTRGNSMASWPNTDEGRICDAATRVAEFIIWQTPLEAAT